MKTTGNAGNMYHRVVFVKGGAWCLTGGTRAPMSISVESVQLTETSLPENIRLGVGVPCVSPNGWRKLSKLSTMVHQFFKDTGGMIGLKTWLFHLLVSGPEGIPQPQSLSVSCEMS